MNKIEQSLPQPDHKDHFVPQVYLRRFIDPSTKKLHVYDRKEDRWFEAPTKRICFEPGWDKLDAEGNNTYLAEHLKALEPCLKQFLEGFKRGPISPKDRYYFSTWLAIIFALSPKRNEYDFLSLQMLGHNIDPESTELKFNLRQRNLGQAKHIANMIYAYDWHLTYNFSEIPFITCDFPAHYLCLNDTIPPMYQPFGIVLDPGTFLRINPKLVTQPEVYQPGFIDYTKIQPGALIRGQISRHWKHAQRLVSRINEQSIYNAERFVISSYKNDGLAQFVKNRKNRTTVFQPKVENTPNGTVLHTTLQNNFKNVPLMLDKNTLIKS